MLTWRMNLPLRAVWKSSIPLLPTLATMPRSADNATATTGDAWPNNTSTGPGVATLIVVASDKRSRNPVLNIRKMDLLPPPLPPPAAAPALAPPLSADATPATPRDAAATAARAVRAVREATLAVPAATAPAAARAVRRGVAANPRTDGAPLAWSRGAEDT